MFRRCCARLSGGILQPNHTTLSNGLQVVTFAEQSPISSVGLFVRIGPRFELKRWTGCSLMLEANALSANERYSAAELQNCLVKSETSFSNIGHREVHALRAECMRWDFEDTLRKLFSLVCDIRFDEEAFRGHIEGLSEYMEVLRSEPTRFLFDLLHQAAWKNQTLGLPGLVNNDDIEALTAAKYKEFISTFVRPGRMAVVARGVEHDVAVALAEEISTQSFEGSTFLDIPEEATAPSVYTGGECNIHNTEAPPSRVKFEEKNFTHAGVMYKSVPASAGKEYIVNLVTQGLLGGGSAFSSGGPGKGLQTKLFRECLCTYRWLDSVECITASYTDAGLIGIHGTAPHIQTNELLQVLGHQLATVPQRLKPEAIEIGRHQLRAQLFFSLEERGPSVDEVGRALMLRGKLWRGSELREMIESVTLADIEALMDKCVRTPVTLSIYGNTTNAHTAAELQQTYMRPH
eukprot:Hpha_TRINITY_DN15036_c1_g8::TRINITY_DN15036_c1_g8_i1::g.123301::m.123301/K01412/PMPCA, MAS2; mitochondrial-processing peptidase subunit alpha